MEARVRITMEGEHLRDMKIFLGDAETEITTMVTRAEIILDANNNRPIINLTLLPREIELPESIIAQMNVDRIHLMKPSERFARWRASRGKAVKGMWRRFVDRLPRKAPTIKVSRPSAFVAPTVDGEARLAMELRRDDGSGQPGEPIDARADGTIMSDEEVMDFVLGIPDEELDYIGPMTDVPTEVALESQARREIKAEQQQRLVRHG